MLEHYVPADEALAVAALAVTGLRLPKVYLIGGRPHFLLDDISAWRTERALLIGRAS